MENEEPRDIAKELENSPLESGDEQYKSCRFMWRDRRPGPPGLYPT